MSAVDRILRKIELNELEQGFTYIGQGCGCGILVLCIAVGIALIKYGWPF